MNKVFERFTVSFLAFVSFQRNASRKSRLDLVSALRDQERDLEGGEAVEEVESEEEKNRIARLSLYTRPSLPRYAHAMRSRYQEK